MRGLWFSCFMLALFGAIPASYLWAEQHPIRLRQADLMRTETNPVGVVRFLDGNVWITQDTLSITGDHAVYQESTGVLNFTGHVHFKEPTRQIWANEGTYFDKDGRATAQGNVHIEQDSLTVNCDRVVYQEERKEANLFGDVVIHSLKENAILTGGHGFYSRPQGHAAMEINPCLVRHFTATDSTVVTGRIIDYYFDKQEAMVTDSAHIRRNDFDAWSDKAYYFNQGEWAQLLGRPVLKRGMDTMRADTVNAYFKEQVLQHVHLAGKAVATSPVDSLYPVPINQMTGRLMDLIFVKNQLDSIHVQGNAASVYYVRQQSRENGANRISGDAIDMKLSKGQITWIYVEGGTEGIYFPQQLEKMVDSDAPVVSKPSPSAAKQARPGP